MSEEDQKILKLLRETINKFRDGTYRIGNIEQTVTSYGMHQVDKYPIVRSLTITFIDYGEEQE